MKKISTDIFKLDELGVYISIDAENDNVFYSKITPNGGPNLDADGAIELTELTSTDIEIIARIFNLFLNQVEVKKTCCMSSNAQSVEK